MSNITYGNNTVMCYPTVAAGYQSSTAAPQWEGDYLYTVKQGNAAVSILRQFHIDAANPQENANISGSTLGVVGMDPGAGGSFALSPDGTHLVFSVSSSNYAQFASINTPGLTLNTTLGNTSNLGPLNSTPSILLQSFCFGAFRVGGSDQILWGALNGNGEADITPFALGLNSNICLGNLTYQFVSNRLVSGRYDGGGTGWIASLPMGSGGSSANPIAFWMTTGSLPSHIGDLAPTDVDPTWTQFSRAILGIAFDETDGNLIIQVTAGSGTTPVNGRYVVKISSVDASVIWTCPIPTTNSYQWSLTFSRIRNGTLHVPSFSHGAAVVYHIDTSDGSAVTESIGGISVNGPFYSDDVTNSIIYYGGFVTGFGTNPDFVGEYMGNNSHHSVNNAWMRFFFATSAPPPPPTGQKRRLVSMTGPIYL